MDPGCFIGGGIMGFITYGIGAWITWAGDPYDRPASERLRDALTRESIAAVKSILITDRKKLSKDQIRDTEIWLAEKEMSAEEAAERKARIAEKEAPMDLNQFFAHEFKKKAR